MTGFPRLTSHRQRNPGFPRLLTAMYFLAVLHITACASVESHAADSAALNAEIMETQNGTQATEAENGGANSAALSAELAESTDSAERTESGTGLPAVTMEIPDNRLVERYRKQYTSENGLKYLSAVMQRSVPYRNFILAEIERLGAPDFLLYLPVIESGFTEKAVSRSGAVGIWQFMRNSVGGYNIRINEWLDERRDPWLSSTAAVKKLMENYNYFGDWELALAAYNCGLGAVSRAVKRAGTSDYWELCERGYFKTETVHYVPKFLAIAEILANSEAFGIDWGEADALTAYEVLPVKKAVDINLVAKETGAEQTLLQKLNPALHYSITPPDASYGLRIPAEIREETQALLDSGKMLVEYYVYKIRSGDTLYALSRHYGVSVDMITKYNPGIRPNALKIGSKVLIPALKEVPAYRGNRGDGNLDFTGSYLVKQGDTLWSIALAHNVQVETLAEKNNLDVNSILKLGKLLKVPAL